MPQGPNGEKRPQSSVEAAVQVGRIAVGEKPQDAPRGPRRLLLPNDRGEPVELAEIEWPTQEEARLRREELRAARRSK